MKTSPHDDVTIRSPFVLKPALERPCGDSNETAKFFQCWPITETISLQHERDRVCKSGRELIVTENGLRFCWNKLGGTDENVLGDQDGHVHPTACDTSADQSLEVGSERLAISWQLRVLRHIARDSPDDGAEQEQRGNWRVLPAWSRAGQYAG